MSSQNKKPGPKGPRKPTDYSAKQLFAHHKQVARYGRIVDPLLDHHLCCYKFHHSRVFGEDDQLGFFKDIRVGVQNGFRYPLNKIDKPSASGHGILLGDQIPKSDQERLNLALLIRSKTNLSEYLQYCLSWDAIRVFEDIGLIWERLSDKNWRAKDDLVLGIIECFEKYFPTLPTRDEINAYFAENLGNIAPPSDTKKKEAMRNMRLCLASDKSKSKHATIRRRYQRLVGSYLSSICDRRFLWVTDIPDFIRYVRYADSLGVDLARQCDENLCLDIFRAIKFVQIPEVDEKALKHEFYLTPAAHSKDFIKAVSMASKLKFRGLL